ncbi:hypothetical protein PROSTU_04466 [Providencia stuartii ATCC 25827]|uniref:Uncharacterized protein n=2 Tax=Morganellaceae TaxID=1903414 RepID=A0AA87CP76_PROST|nr:hypothetical protein PROSTU_04466 [Providencia stuartii ATCC 25827]
MQGCKQEIDMTIERKIQKIELATQIGQLKEENAKLKQAIISIYTNTEEITLNGEDGYYAVKQSVIDDVIDLTED